MRHAGGRAGERAWLERTLEVTLRSIGALAEEGARTSTPGVVSAIRDLGDQACIWAELLGALAVPAPEADASGAGALPGGVPPRVGREPAMSVDVAVLLSRVAHGLRRRLQDPEAPIGAESRRAALCCVADLETHARDADLRVRRAESRGLGEDVRRARARSPSPQEFLSSTAAARGPVRSAGPRPEASVRPCPAAPRPASSAA